MLAVAPYDGEKPGAPSEIRVVELADPVPAEGEVLVDVAASALNRADLLQMRGLYPPPQGASDVPGLECSGVVSAVGPDVDEELVGRQVMALLSGGGQATKVCIPAGQLMDVPQGLGLVTAAALPEAALTSWTNLVYEGRLSKGETLLLTGAASGVGTFAVQLARELGARVWVVGRSVERLERLRELGAEEVFALDEDLPAAVREASAGKGVDLVMDLVGGAWLQQFLACLRGRGRLVLVGVLAGTRCDVDLGLVLRQRLEIRGSVLRSRSLGEKAGLIASFTQFAAERLDGGSLEPVIDRTLPLERAADAYAAMQHESILGKILLEMPTAQGQEQGS